MAPIPDPKLRVDLAGIELASPVILAAGTAGVLDEMGEQLDLSRVGALVTKSITPEPREGNRAWRVWPTRVGMLNAIGLANPGIDAFMRDHAPKAAGLPCRVIGSIAGFSVEDYTRVASAFDMCEGIAGAELNVSCPNVHGGVEFGSEPGLLGELVASVRAELKQTKLLVKLPPVTTPAPNSIVDLARSAIEAGADALCLCNTTPAMAIDVRSRKPALGNTTGGLSGPAVHAQAVKIVYDVHRLVARDAGVPIVGIGGVTGWKDAAELVLAGASAVEVGTALFADPRAPIRIARGLSKWVRSQGASDISGLTGAVRTH
ncbi:MAG: dihydroorotate dehydrogenase [Phycisphaerales bacterium JB059]